MQLTKHHGLGNDFLVLHRDHQPDPALAVAACHRHRGIGADGLLYLGGAEGSPGSPADPAADVTTADVSTADVSMVLLNADGSRAEMSGNGIGCLVQAAVLGGHASGPAVRVRTDAGLRVVRLAGGADARTHVATIAMGAVSVADDDPGWNGDGILRATRVDVGNPHLVLELADPSRLQDRGWLAELGAKANAAVAGGINVEVVVVSDDATLSMDVYERGVGLTDACGTGAVAAAAAARRWGAVGDTVSVAMRGGAVDVALGVAIGGQDSQLTTTITYVGSIEFPWP